MKQSKSCDCKKCVSCCWSNPGWFGSMKEVAGAAKIMAMSVKDFSKEYLIREWWCGSEEVSVPAPRRDFSRMTGVRKTTQSEVKKILKDPSYGEEEKIKNGKGFVRATWGHNIMTGYACVFLDENQRCRIHESKPRECRLTFACSDKKSSNRRRVEAVKYWKKHQAWITT